MKQENIVITPSHSKIHAFAKYLGMDAKDVEQPDDNILFTNGFYEWLVLTDEEANLLAEERILESLWAFRAEWIAKYINLDDHAHKALIEILQLAQDKYCETLNPIILKFISDKKDEFIRDAIEADGRGHFLAPYDFEENEEGEYFLYKQ